jgi:hypothetical protein
MALRSSLDQATMVPAGPPIDCLGSTYHTVEWRV